MDLKRISNKMSARPKDLSSQKTSNTRNINQQFDTALDNLSSLCLGDNTRRKKRNSTNVRPSTSSYPTFGESESDSFRSYRPDTDSSEDELDSLSLYNNVRYGTNRRRRRHDTTSSYSGSCVSEDFGATQPRGSRRSRKNSYTSSYISEHFGARQECGSYRSRNNSNSSSYISEHFGATQERGSYRSRNNSYTSSYISEHFGATQERGSYRSRNNSYTSSYISEHFSARQERGSYRSRNNSYTSSYISEHFGARQERGSYRSRNNSYTSSYISEHFGTRQERGSYRSRNNSYTSSYISEHFGARQECVSYRSRNNSNSSNYTITDSESTTKIYRNNQNRMGDSNSARFYRRNSYGSNGSHSSNGSDTATSTSNDSLTHAAVHSRHPNQNRNSKQRNNSGIPHQQPHSYPFSSITDDDEYKYSTRYSPWDYSRYPSMPYYETSGDNTRNHANPIPIVMKYAHLLTAYHRHLDPNKCYKLYNPSSDPVYPVKGR